MRIEMLLHARAIACCLVSLAAAAPSRADDRALDKQTIVYKTVGPTAIELDVFRRNGAQVRPAVVWIHGGALINGDRNSVPRELAKLCDAHDYVLLSIDYRLAPEVKLPAIIDDLK